MKRSVLIFILLLAVVVYSAPLQRIQSPDFSIGLVTAKKLPNQKFEEAVVCKDIDLSKNPGSLTPRLGYSQVASLPTVDSILWNGIHAINYRNGDKQFMTIGKWDDSGFAGLFASDINGFGFGVFDSIKFVPDTATGLADARALGFSQYGVSLAITSGNTYCGYTIIIDTTVRLLADIIDSLYAVVNSQDCGICDSTACADLLAAIIDNGDTLILVEQTSELLIQVADTADFSFPICPLDTTRVNSSIDTADVTLSRFPAVDVPRYAQFRDLLYISNGVSKGVIFDGRTTADFPTRAPGEPSILPLTTTGTLNGVYRYATRFKRPDTTFDGAGIDSIFSNTHSTLSTPVRVDNGQVLIYNFAQPAKDISRTGSIQAGADTIAAWIEIWRSTGDMGLIDVNDTLWLIDSVQVTSATDYVTTDFTDTTSDVTARTSSSRLAVELATSFAPDTIIVGSITPTYTYQGTSGGPGIVSWDSTGTTADTSGLWLGSTAFDWSTVAGWAWMIVAVDTTTNIPSDSSRSIVMFQQSKPIAYTSSLSTVAGALKADSVHTGMNRSLIEQIRLVLPDDTNSNVIYELYRGPVVPIKIDSTWGVVTKRVTDTTSTDGFVTITLTYPVTERVYRHFAEEVEIPIYYLLGHFNPGDTLLDSLHYDSLLLRAQYTRNATPSMAGAMVAAGNRLMVSDGNSIHMGRVLDSGLVFDVLEQKPINPDDGDQITAIWEQSQGVIKIAKNKNMYNGFFQGGLWQVPQLANHFGCIAPLSHAASPEGDYFLSIDGVRREVEGVQKERSFIPTLVSTQLGSFKNFSTSDLKTAIGIYWDNKYILSIPPIGSTFVANKVIWPDQRITYGWSTWSLQMVGATTYRTSSDNIVMPGDTLYFIKSNDNRIYTFGNVRTDNGTRILWGWESGPSNQIDGFMKTIDDISFYISTADSGAPIMWSLFYDEKGTARNGGGILFNRLDTAAFVYYDEQPYVSSLFWRIGIFAWPFWTPITETSIDKMWMTLKSGEHYGSQK